METFENSAELNSSESISLPAASPARISRKLESGQELKETAAVFGLNMLAWFGNLDPATCSLKTSQVSLFTQQCEESSESWPESGIWDFGEVYELRNSEPPTSENECSSLPGTMLTGASWPTPQAEQGGFPRNTPQTHAGRFRGNPMAQAVENFQNKIWPTVRTTDAKGGFRGCVQTESGAYVRPSSQDEEEWFGANLSDVALTWPTPSASVANDGETPESWERRRQLNLEKNYNGNGQGTPLTIAASTWPTARTTDQFGGRAMTTPNGRRRVNGKSNFGPQLNDAATTWPTATTKDAHSAARHTTKTGKMHDGTSLTDAIQMWPTPQAGNDVVDRTTDSGHQKQLGVEAHNWWPTARQEDGESCGNHPGATDSLTGATKNWKTPHGMSNVDAKGKVGGCGGGEFAKQANHWATPRSFDSQTLAEEPSTTTGDRKQNQTFGHATLARQTSHHWPTPNVPNGGRTSSTSNYREDGSKQQIHLEAVADLWTTPQAHQSGANSKRDDRGSGGPDLKEQVEHWQTPIQPLGGGKRRSGDRAEELMLPGQAEELMDRFWPTVTARDWKNGDASEETLNKLTGRPLTEIVEHWPTPRVPHHAGWETQEMKDERGSKTGIDLEGKAMLWWTPHMTRKNDSENSDSTYLAKQVSRIFQPSRQDQAIPDGPSSSESDQTSRRHWQTPSVSVTVDGTQDIQISDGMGQRGKFGNLLEQVAQETQGMGPRRLNPRFVEWLMGLPVGWTEL